VQRGDSKRVDIKVSSSTSAYNQKICSDDNDSYCVDYRGKSELMYNLLYIDSTNVTKK